MAGQTVMLHGPSQRTFAKTLIDAAPLGAVLNIHEAKRSDVQNDKMWAMLSDISRSWPQGRRETADVWKSLAMHACGWEVQFIEGLDGRPFPYGHKSSKLTVRQMSDLIEWLYAFGAENNVVWSKKETDK